MSECLNINFLPLSPAGYFSPTTVTTLPRTLAAGSQFLFGSGTLWLVCVMWHVHSGSVWLEESLFSPCLLSSANIPGVAFFRLARRCNGKGKRKRKFLNACNVSKQVPGLSCKCFLPRIWCTHSLRRQTSIPSALLAQLERGWCPSSTAKILLQPGSPAGHMAAPGCGQPICRQDCALARGGKAGEGKCFIRDTAFSFVHSSGFMSSLQKQCRGQPGQKPAPRWHSRQEPNLGILAQV